MDLFAPKVLLINVFLVLSITTPGLAQPDNPGYSVVVKDGLQARLGPTVSRSRVTR